MAKPNAEPDLTIRAAAPPELAVIAAMHVRAWKNAYEGLIKPECLARYDVSNFVSRYHSLIAQGYTLTVATADNKVVGMAIFHSTHGDIDALSSRRSYGTTRSERACWTTYSPPRSPTRSFWSARKATNQGAASGRSVNSSEPARAPDSIPSAMTSYRPGATPAPEPPVRHPNHGRPSRLVEGTTTMQLLVRGR